MALSAILLLTSCSSPSVRLRYRFPKVISYSWQTVATTASESPAEESTHTVVVTGLITERASAGDKTWSRVTVNITPTSMRIDGKAAQIPPTSNLVVKIDSEGRFVDEGAASTGKIADMSPAQLLAELTPPLSNKPVKIGSTWNVSMHSRSASDELRLKGRGRLLNFRLADRRRLADLHIDRSGSATTTQLKDKTSLSLKGTSHQIQHAAIDVDHGILYSMSDVTISRFNVGIGGSAASGLALDRGTVKIRLSTQMHLKYVRM